MRSGASQVRRKLREQGNAAGLDGGAYGPLLSRGHYLASCNVPETMAVDICAAVQNGHAQGVTVSTDPPNREIAACIAEQVRGLSFPSYPRLDVTHTRFDAPTPEAAFATFRPVVLPHCGVSVSMPVAPTLEHSGDPSSAGTPRFLVYVAKLGDTKFGITCVVHEGSALDESRALDMAYRGSLDALPGEIVRTSKTKMSKSAAVRGVSGHVVEFRTHVLPGGSTYSLMMGPIEALPPSKVEEFLGSLRAVQ